ncbi:cell wall hydrolase [Pelagibius sp.]|uniref:cell wall hydrolase n=1 Tax=Pelagibius sp. TaxID=1931238 RepID=UPI003BAF749A
MTKHLFATAPEDIPDSAGIMYAKFPDLAMAEAPEVLEWSDHWDALVNRQFRDLKFGAEDDPEDAGWQFDPAPDHEWASPEPIFDHGRRFLRGNCNDFAPFLMLRLMAAGIPRGALRLVVCRFGEQGHMVLAVETTAGTLICCNVAGCWALGETALQHHDWIAWEGHNGAWESLQPVGLADLLPAPAFSPEDLDILARTIYGEARGEAWEGKIAVGHVIRNRAEKRGTSPAREAQRPWQFSCWNENDPNRAKLLAVTKVSAAFRDCWAAAEAVLTGAEPDPTGGARHYHTPAVSPFWSRGKEPCAVIGGHLFFNDID